jgi:hypothetical protein
MKLAAGCMDRRAKAAVACYAQCKMKRAEVQQIEKIRCVACHESVPSFEVFSVGSIEKGYRDLCSRCFNTEMAQLGGLMGFEHLDLKPVTLPDAEGKKHEFHFRTHLFGPGVALDAFEIRGGSGWLPVSDHR